MNRQMGAGELARAHEVSCFKSLFPFRGKDCGELWKYAPPKSQIGLAFGHGMGYKSFRFGLARAGADRLPVRALSNRNRRVGDSVVW